MLKKNNKNAIDWLTNLSQVNVRYFFKKSIIMLFPIFSRHSSPSKLFEDMACGILVIGSRLPCVSEIIRA
ncbi:MAG: hypothetical protein U9Q21_02760 [Candidatus Auribacterota bacterium]|nr:hypothetical protein [Candidatus Auribacterota bacterium]